jgi:hypothetical protein
MYGVIINGRKRHHESNMEQAYFNSLNLSVDRSSSMWQREVPILDWSARLAPVECLPSAGLTPGCNGIDSRAAGASPYLRAFGTINIHAFSPV